MTVEPLPDPPGTTGAATEQLRSQVLRVWSELLPGAEPRPDADFLRSGGHSLLAVRLVAGLDRATGRRLAVQEVLAARTPAAIAQLLAAKPRRPATREPVPRGSAPVLTAAQRRLWFVEQLAPGMNAHNIPLVERLRGSLDAAALAEALAAVATRHEVLRWRIAGHGGRPSAVCEPPGEVALALTDLSGLDEAERESALDQLLAHEVAAPFVLDERLWRARLVRLGDEDHVLTLVLHHLVFDGWSRDVLYRDLSRAYQDALRGMRGVQAPAAGFADYAAWVARRDAAAAAAHWCAHLAGAPTVLDLPRDHPRPAVQRFTGADARAWIAGATAARLRSVADEEGATPVAALLAVFGLVLRRLTGHTELLVGTPVADRPLSEFAPLIGMCVQIAALRLRIDDAADFRAHVRAGGEALADALEHPFFPLERIVEGLGVPRDLSRNPLIQVLFNVHDLDGGRRLDLPGLSARSVATPHPGSLFDLTLYCAPREGGIALRAAYNAELYSPGRIQAMLDGFVRLAGQLADRPQDPVSHAVMRPEATTLPNPQEPLPGWSGPGVLEAITAAAGRRGDQTAIFADLADGARELTFAQVMEQVGRTVAALRSAGVQRGEPVAVFAARTPLLVPTLLGVLASGARWSVLDGALPEPVLLRQLAASRARTVLRLTGATLPNGIPEHLRVLEADDVDKADPSDPGAYAAPHDRGYLALTSASTGAHRAVAAGEGPLAHFLHWYPRHFALGGDDRFALLAGLAHDPLLRDAFTSLVLGARLYVPSQSLLRDPVLLRGWLARHAITVVHLTPQSARMICAATQPTPALPDLRLVVLGGDQARYGDVAALRLLAPRARIVNGYGTTETPQLQALYEVAQGAAGTGANEAEPVPVGAGIDGARLLVLGPGGMPAAVGELGEILIQSRHLAEGYLDEAQTAARFTAVGAAPAFRTGDLGRHRPDGTVVLAGRADDQVKIRGFRIELGDIEAALRAQPDVRAACVLAVEDPAPGGGRILRGYAVPARAGVRADALLRQLRAVLPEYAVPADLVLLGALPLTANGKLDKAALPEPEAAPAAPRESGDDPVSGRTELLIAGVWREVLGRPRVRATDNFFEIGGQSLSVAAVQARLADMLSRQIPVVDLFRFPTIRALAAHLDGGAAGGALVDRAAHRGTRRRNRRPAQTARRRTEPGDPR